MAKRSDPFAIELTPDLVLRAYRAGVFPMAEDASSPDLFWVAPEKRGIVPLDGFHISKSLRKTLRTHPYAVRVDTDFDAVISACAEAADGRETTWINDAIRDTYGQLFRRGQVHTVEVWDGEALVGGLYGLSIGGAFFGESMFHRKTDASKIAMAHLVKRLNAGGYVLLDTQFITEHLATLGAVEIARVEYERQLRQALLLRGDWHALDRIAPTGEKGALLTHQP